MAEETDLSLIPVFNKENENKNMADVSGIKLFKISQKTEAFLKSSFSPNQVRRQWRDKFRGPNTVYTICPSTDKVIKSRLSAVTKSHDKQLAQQQACLPLGQLPTSWRRLPKASSSRK